MDEESGKGLVSGLSGMVCFLPSGESALCLGPGKELSGWGREDQIFFAPPPSHSE